MSLPLLQCHSLTWFVHDHVFPTLLVPRRIPEQTRIEVRMVTYHLSRDQRHPYIFCTSLPDPPGAFDGFRTPGPSDQSSTFSRQILSETTNLVRTFQKVWGIPAFSFSGGWIRLTCLSFFFLLVLNAGNFREWSKKHNRNNHPSNPHSHPFPSIPY